MRQFRQNGRGRADYLGAGLQQVTSDIAAAVGPPEIAGAIVNELDADFVSALRRAALHLAASMPG